MSEPLLPPVDADSAPFWEGARNGELRIQRCAVTGRLIFPPRPMSPWDPHAEPVWTAVSGRGAIWSFVVPHPPLLPQFAELAPYNVIVVALDEDPTIRLVGNLVARAGGPIDEVDPATIEIGAAVRVVFEPVSDAIHLPRWVLA
ncbi:MAG: OB-fold domain-containing protein [Deltaproteobacteria bacterium]|nr:MAG: OB-fold domain-containing protein [Deltaproteobacteria bacterium]